MLMVAVRCHVFCDVAISCVAAKQNDIVFNYLSTLSFISGKNVKVNPIPKSFYSHVSTFFTVSSNEDIIT